MRLSRWPGRPGCLAPGSCPASSLCPGSVPPAALACVPCLGPAGFGFGLFPSCTPSSVSLFRSVPVAHSLILCHPLRSLPVSPNPAPQPAHLGSPCCLLSPSLSVALSVRAGGLSSAARPAPLTGSRPAGSPHVATWTSLPPEGAWHPPPLPPGAAVGPAAARGPGEAAGQWGLLGRPSQTWIPGDFQLSSPLGTPWCGPPALSSPDCPPALSEALGSWHPQTCGSPRW